MLIFVKDGMLYLIVNLERLRMSGNIVNLFSENNEELKGCGYYEVDGIGLAMLDKSLIVLSLNMDDFEVTLGDSSYVYKRHELSEFLKVAAILVDSEDRFLPELDLIGMNYKSE